MSDKVELKGCAHCGGNNVTTYANDDTQAAAIYCDDCPAGIEDSTLTGEELIAAWNTRPDVAALQTALQEAEASITEFEAAEEVQAHNIKHYANMSLELERKLELLQPQWSDDAPEEGMYNEVWKCFACDEMAPCTWICTTTNEGIGVTEEMDPRFRHKICPARETGVDKPTWVRLPNVILPPQTGE